MIKRLFFSLLLLLAACSERLVGPNVSTDAEAIHIAFFAELMSEAPSSEADAYCLSIGNWPDRDDPTEDVVNDLNNIFNIVQPASACTYAPGSITANGDPARAYHIDPFTVVGQTADVTGFWRDNDAEGASYVGHLEKQGELWVVTQFELAAELH